MGFVIFALALQTLFWCALAGYCVGDDFDDQAKIVFIISLLMLCLCVPSLVITASLIK